MFKMIFFTVIFIISGRQVHGEMLCADRDTFILEQKDAGGSLGNTILHLAVIETDEDLIKCLLENGAEINAQNKLGNTPLHLAVRSGDSDLIQLLVSGGADPGIPNKEGDTALDWALVNSSEREIQLLFDRMVRIGIRNCCFTEEQAEKIKGIFQFFVN